MQKNNFFRRYPYVTIFILIIILGYFYNSYSNDLLKEKYSEKIEEDIVRLEQVKQLKNNECNFNKYDCADFSTYSKAKSVYDECGGVKNDVHHLDGDGDGIPCEELYYNKKWQE
jgi:hypothetical protein